METQFETRVVGNLKQLNPLVKRLEPKPFRAICECVLVCHTRGEDAARERFQALRESFGSDAGSFDKIFSLLLTIFNRILRVPPNLDVISKDLEILAFPAPLVAPLIAVFRKGSKFPYSPEGSPVPHYVNVKWRVDVAISTSALQRVLRPTVFMQLETSDGKFHRFELSPEQFADLRYGIARVLGEMGKKL